MIRFSAAGLLLTVLLTACSERPASQLTPPAAAADAATVVPETFTATGVLTLTLPVAGDSVEGALDSCAYLMPVQPGDQITIEDASKKIVGFARLQPIEFDTDDGTCRMNWEAAEIPASGGVFSVKFGGYEPIYFRRAEGEAGLVTRLPDPVGG